MAHNWKSIQAFLLFLTLCGHGTKCATIDASVITNFTVKLIKSSQAIIFSCITEELKSVSIALMEQNQMVLPVNLNASYTLARILSRKNYAQTAVIVNTECSESKSLLAQASADRYFNKTYQWLLWGMDQNIEHLLPIELDYVGPNAQITFVNKSQYNDKFYKFWDIHSKGRHLKSKLEIHLIAEMTTNDGKLKIVNDIFELQGIRNRAQFNGLTLRGACVIDQENITTNEQIETILGRPSKDSGVAAFIKYHYELLNLLRQRFNFNVKFRNSRGWAGRLGNTTFRMGLLGIIKRNEADVAASGSFNRINRFAEFDTIHQSWKFETAFLFRYTPELNTHHTKSGNFLAPFSRRVWIVSFSTIVVVNLVWLMVDFVNRKWNAKIGSEQENSELSQTENQNSSSYVALQIFAAICQQGMDRIPFGFAPRSIVMTIYLFSLVMYNFYTSSVVGGLLSSSEQGPTTVEEVSSSALKISFEDIGYYKVLFRESQNPIVTRLISRKLSSNRSPNELPVYSFIENAVPYLKAGGFAFHCEVVDAYPMIAEKFDAMEICDLRVVSGLMDVELMNWIVHKNSQYTEIFKIAMCNARETGLVERILRQRQIRKPACQYLYTVYPVTLSGVMSAYFTLLVGAMLAILTLGLELAYKKINSSSRHDNLIQMFTNFKRN